MSSHPDGTWLTFQFPALQAKEGTAWIIRILPTPLAKDILKISRDLPGTVLIIGWAYIKKKGGNPDNLRTNTLVALGKRKEAAEALGISSTFIYKNQ